jgi:ATP-dependent DNA helicase RecG
LFLQYSLLKIKHSISSNNKSIIKIPKKYNNIEEFINKLPFTLTNAQLRVFNEVSHDMESDKPMNRLVQGDVGSGKTIVAAMAAYKAIKSGFQAVMMAPTSILAMQHYNYFEKLFKPFGINVQLLTSNITKRKKNEIISFLRQNILVSYVHKTDYQKHIESLEMCLIQALKPIINIKHNPYKSPVLKAARVRCRIIAKST